VTKLGGWAPEFSGTHWIAPDADQSSSTRDGKYFGSVTYQTQFTATRGLTLNTRVLADDDVAVSLNGKTVFSSTGGQQYRFAAMFKMTGFASGMNTVVFTVSNSGGGPTGLDVAFADANAPPSGQPLALNSAAYPGVMSFSSTNAGATSAQTLYVVNNGDAVAPFAASGLPSGSLSIDGKTQSWGGPHAPGSYSARRAPASISAGRRRPKSLAPARPSAPWSVPPGAPALCR
jgi:hypothetical protein